MNGTILSTETHLHLYGCLNADDLWEMFCQRRSRLQSRLAWFDKGYADKFSVDPGFSNLSKSIDPKTFKEIYEVIRHTDFGGFQCKFNLAIALAPPDPFDMTPLKTVLSRDSVHGGIKEYRVFEPFYLPSDQRASYLLQVLATAKDFKSSQYHPWIALTLQRDNALLEPQLSWLLEFMSRHPSECEMISGLDFCGEEFNHPPIEKSAAFKTIHTKTPLSVLYHIGEMWRPEDILLNLKWIDDALGLGVKRLGHALILASPLEFYNKQTLRMDGKKFEDFYRWLNGKSDSIRDDLREDFVLLDVLHANMAMQGLTVTLTLDEHLIQGINQLRKWLRLQVKQSNAIVEVCPTSNLRTALIDRMDHHPIHVFRDESIPFTISTDDPGIFDISLKAEEDLIRRSLKLTDTELNLIERTAKNILQR